MRPMRQSENLSHAQVNARASSILAYLVSVGISEREIYAIGFMSPSGYLCSNTAPSPWDEAPSETTVSRLGSKSARIGADI